MFSGPFNVCQDVKLREYGGQLSSRWSVSKAAPESAITCPLAQQDILGHYGCVNAVEFGGPDDRFMASGGDDHRVLLWRTASVLASQRDPVKYVAMRATHDSNIFCLAFDHTAERVLSSGNDHQVIVHDVESCAPKDVFLLEDACYCIGVHPESDNIFLTATEDGKISLTDMRADPSQDPTHIAKDRAAFHAATFNPVEPQLVASASAKDGVQLWDLRRPLWPLLRCGQRSGGIESAMSVRWRSSGKELFALRRKLEPVLYGALTGRPMALFDAEGYYNSCTMKTCSFAGPRDSLVVSGSDDFRLYLWSVPDLVERDVKRPVKIKKEILCLSGHRSIVNQVRYSQSHQILVSCGVEKLIKVWSPWKLQHRVREKPRPLYSQEEYIAMVLRTGQASITHDYGHESVAEDTRMMAFFDSLIQREMDSSSEDESSSISGDLMDRLSSAHPRDSEPSASMYQNTVVDSESSSSSEESETGGATWFTRGPSRYRNPLSSSSRRRSASYSPFSAAFARYLNSRVEEQHSFVIGGNGPLREHQETSEIGTPSGTQNPGEQTDPDSDFPLSPAPQEMRPEQGYLNGNCDISVRSIASLVRRKRREQQARRLAEARIKRNCQRVASRFGASAILDMNDASARRRLGRHRDAVRSVIRRQAILRRIRKRTLMDLSSDSGDEEMSDSNQPTQTTLMVTADVHESSHPPGALRESDPAAEFSSSNGSPQFEPPCPPPPPMASPSSTPRPRLSLPPLPESTAFEEEVENGRQSWTQFRRRAGSGGHRGHRHYRSRSLQED